MSLKSRLKSLVLGGPGARPRTVPLGLLRGGTFTVDTQDKSMRLLGLDETEIAGWTRRFTHRAGAAVDVGANDGWYSTYFARQPNIQRVFAFEPDDRYHQIMQTNLQLNGPAVQKKVEFSPKFVGNIDDQRTIRLDSVLKNINLPLVIKIDVDGGEVEVLDGTRSTLERLECGIVLEVHSVQLENDCDKLLQSLGYRTRIIDKGWYRAIVPETRMIEHNRWLVAAKSL